MKAVAALLVVPILAACGANAARPVSTGPTVSAPPASYRPATPPPQAPVRQPAPASAGFIPPKVMSVPGLEGVIGASGTRLQTLFGNPRLDVREGDARKLQFTGDACVLDVFLYPLSPGAEPTATYLEARRASDGLDVDRVACVNALRAR